MDTITISVPINISLRLLKLAELSNRTVGQIIIKALESKSCKRIISRKKTWWVNPYCFKQHEVKIDGRMTRRIKENCKRLDMDFNTYIESAIQRYFFNNPDNYWQRKQKQKDPV